MFEIGSRVDKYVLESELGHGGFGVVFVARDLQLDRTVALKLLRPEHTANPAVLQRFLQEARSAAKVAHPGIVTVFECGQTPLGAYLVMELLHGETVARRMHTRLPEAKIIEIGRQVASALHAAHASGIVHRDLKPDNLFLVRDPAAVGGERIKILDFGIAKLFEGIKSGPETGSLMVFGTPQYMSPEQCKSSAKVDLRSDIYSLGCILYELVAGSPPFRGEFGELIGKHLFVEPERLRALAPGVSPALEHVIMQMLVKDPDARPQDMATVLDLLSASASTEPAPLSTAPAAVTSAPTFAAGFPQSTFASSAGMIERAPPRPRRRRLLVALVGAGLGVGGVVAFSLATGGGDHASAPATTRPEPMASPPTAPSAAPPPSAAPASPPPTAPPSAREILPPVAAPTEPQVAPPSAPPAKRPRKVRGKPPRPASVTPAPTPPPPPDPKPPTADPKPECAKPPCKKLDGAL